MGLGRKQIWTILFCAYLAAVAFLCFMKTDNVPEMPTMIFGMELDKIAHFLMFFPYPFIAYEAFRPKSSGMCIHFCMLAVMMLTGIGLAIGTEEVQGLLGYRENDINDANADILGIICSTILTGIYILIRKNRS